MMTTATATAAEMTTTPPTTPPTMAPMFADAGEDGAGGASVVVGAMTQEVPLEQDDCVVMPAYARVLAAAPTLLATSAIVCEKLDAVSASRLALAVPRAAAADAGKSTGAVMTRVFEACSWRSRRPRRPARTKLQYAAVVSADQAESGMTADDDALVAAERMT